MYLDVLTVSSIVPELLGQDITSRGGSLPNYHAEITVNHSGQNRAHSGQNDTTMDHSGQNDTTMDHSGVRNFAAGADQSDQMAAAAGSPQSSQQHLSSNNSGQHSSYPQTSSYNSYGNTSSFSSHGQGPNSERTTSQQYSQGTAAPYTSFSAHSATNAGFDLTPCEPGNVLDELSAMFEETATVEIQ